MSALDRLRHKMREAGVPSLRLAVHGDLLDFNRTFAKSNANAAAMSDDLVRESVERFWQEQKLESLRDAQLVSYGLLLKLDSSTACILEDRERFRAVLDVQSGVGQWLESPRWFRRCYRGLLNSYFTYDGRDSNKPGDGRKNWSDLRNYLWQNTTRIVDVGFDVDWVNIAVKSRSLFSEAPCAEWADAALAGDTEVIDEITNELGISRNSWFHWELIMAQVHYATELADEEFGAQISKLLSLIGGNEFVREKAMVQILDRYAESQHPVMLEGLRDKAVAWWGNPWLPSDEVRWGGVQPRTRAMVAEWLRGEFIEAFFAKLARDGVGDKRRANFWLKYLKSMSDVRFGLGSIALNSSDRDFRLLREKMKGLFQRFDDPVGSNNAFIMNIGELVAVEFGGEGNAFYGYDRRKALPFDFNRPLQSPVGVRNSLKHKPPVQIFRMRHQDGINGYNRWEDMFAAELEGKFGIVPDARQQVIGGSNRRSSLVRHAEGHDRTLPSVPAFSDAALASFAAMHGIRIRDNRSRHGNLRVDTHDLVAEVTRVLRAWGFTYHQGEFWWKK
jgi:hypothetical protein